jgi:uncharacterized membrane protein YjgN (DUF898 family)
MSASSAPVDRPRSVVVAFWCWVTAAVLTAAFGLLVASTSIADFFRLAGVLLVVVGLAQGYLAGRARRGQQRFASAAVGLAMASVAVLAVLLILGVAAVLGVIIVAVIMILLITGAVMSQRPTSQQWYESEGVG